jgi:succinylglutamate desuccinylase
MIAMTGIHGNEPAGVLGAERVFARIQRERVEVRGTFVALAGNLKALTERTRFVDKDLNRQWTAERLTAIRQSAVSDAEVAEQSEVLAVIRDLIHAARGTVFFLDLHTTSAASSPFVTVGDTLRNRAFARQFPLPLILGLEEQVDGALLEYLNGVGVITMGFEAGQHDCDRSADRSEALLWLALRRTGMVAPDGAEDQAHTTLLREASRGVPSIVEVRHRHALTEQDQFKMLPGFDNFVPVKKNQVVAHDVKGPVRVPEDGLMLLPLYQGKGEDGFFVARPVRMVWLRVSAFLRRRGLLGGLHWLPGVRRGVDPSNELVVNTRIARWYPLEIFHLFGFRKLRQTGDTLVVTRRPFDIEDPGQIRL